MTSYLTYAAADAIAATIPALVAYAAATNANKALALIQASLDVDLAMRYQGRKYLDTQEHQFPRIHGDPAVQSSYPYDLPAGGSEIWDWDSATSTAIVPAYVNLAVLYQADSIIEGAREKRLKDLHDKITSQSADGLSETFSGNASRLCRRAYEIMREYKLRSGSMV